MKQTISTKKVSDLSSFGGNPRTISDEALESLKRAMVEFGDLSGIEVRKIPNFNSYFCDSNGEIHSIFKGGRTLKPKIDKDGYENVVLYECGRKKHLRVHQIIAVSFIGPKQNGMCVNHMDGIRRNNRPNNLEWLSPADNERHARRVLKKRCVGEKASRSKISRITAMTIFLFKGSGIRQKAIAKQFSISQSQVSRIFKKKNWEHIHAS